MRHLPAITIDGLAAIRGLRDRLCMGGLGRGMRRMGGGVPLGEQIFGPAQALGARGEGIVGAWRRSDHRFERRVGRRRRSGCGEGRTRRHGGRWRNRGSDRDHIGNRFYGGRAIRDQRVPVATATHQRGAAQTQQQQGATAQGPYQRIIAFPGRGGLSNGGCRASLGNRSGCGRNGRGSGCRQLGSGRSLRNRSALCRPFCTRRGCPAGLSVRTRGCLFSFGRSVRGGDARFYGWRRLNHRLAGRKDRRGTGRRRSSVHRCRGRLSHRRHRRRNDNGLRKQRGCTQDQNSGNRGPGGADDANILCHNGRSTDETINRLHATFQIRDEMCRSMDMPNVMNSRSSCGMNAIFTVTRMLTLYSSSSAARSSR